jgi:hypothetical protein
MAELKASCLCGAVRLKATPVAAKLDACHCSMCQKWGGGPFLEVDCKADVTVEGEKNISVFSSSEWAERGFCSKCGSHLFYRLKQGDSWAIPVGLFDEAPAVDFQKQIFIDEKPPFYSFAEKTETMTGAEAFAQYTGDD